MTRAMRGDDVHARARVTRVMRGVTERHLHRQRQRHTARAREGRYSYIQISRFKYVYEPFPHLKCENSSECEIGMDCPALPS